MLRDTNLVDIVVTLDNTVKFLRRMKPEPRVHTQFGKHIPGNLNSLASLTANHEVELIYFHTANILHAAH